VHSHTFPFECSSQDSHVPHGVAPPEQLAVVFRRMRLAPTMRAALSKWMQPTPPCPGGPKISLLETYV
jgi:hypothetical protein